MNPSIQANVQSLRRAPCDLVGTLELALYLQCSRKWVERAVARGLLTPIRIGRNWRFSRSEVIEKLTRAA
jgi:excisionase family DNA binding protein